MSHSPNDLYWHVRLPCTMAASVSAPAALPSGATHSRPYAQSRFLLHSSATIYFVFDGEAHPHARAMPTAEEARSAIKEERALPATGGGRRPEHRQERALPATGGGRRPEHREERALPATGGGRRPEHRRRLT